MPTETPTTAEANAMPDRGPSDRGLRSNGMRDLGPGEMARFRQIERTFLEAVAVGGYQEIRTPTIEPLHLYTAAGTLSPQALDRVYSFLDWDGWSGERVVLRPDATVAVARWYGEQGGSTGGAEARVSYVQPVYRFAAEGDREVWQCGVELFGVGAAAADAELLVLARNTLAALGLADVTCDLAHAGLVRAAFVAAGLSATEQLEAYDRMLEGDAGVTADLVATHPAGAAALRLLSEVDGTSVGYVANLRAAMLPVMPEVAGALDELEAAARALEGAGVPFRVLAGTARSFEYYSGLTFSFRTAGRACVSGGRYDGLAETIGGAAAPGCGWAADIVGLADILGTVRS
ncbi:MAG: ATP phosphoribosyltransferase regulatory subunit [Chloroflexi bacterium]|nr:ATP phosphoribosyltransferase regulatory subunit [Chloroflexota bacterium]